MWDPVPWLGIELQPPALGVWNLSQYSSRKVHLSLFLNWDIIDIQYCISFICTHDNSVFVYIVKWSPQWVLRNLCAGFHVAASVSILTSSTQGFPFHCILASIWFFVLLLITILTDMRWYLIVVLICISLMIRNLSIFPFVCWPVCLLWKKCLFRASVFFLVYGTPRHPLHPPPPSPPVKVHHLSPWTTRKSLFIFKLDCLGFFAIEF